MKSLEKRAREILTLIKLKSHGDSMKYEVIWGAIDGEWCLSWEGHKMSNKQALEKIKTALESETLNTGTVSRHTQVIEGIEIKKGQHVLHRWIPVTEEELESGDHEGFQISLDDRWVDANSIDFDFI